MLDRYFNIVGNIINDGLAIAPNATLTFETVLDGSSVVIGDDGNPVLETETIEVQCYLVQRKQPVTDVQAGVNLDKDYFEGRLVEPLFIDFPVREADTVKGVINGRSCDCFIQNMMESPTSQQYDMKGKVGQRLCLYATFEGGR